ncbi:MAG: hypothetical protein P1V20_09765 [Verrucomicrobiales bacterium]|nr:hypothetical protein [Verrucomicrobiales bacterium]
MKSNHITDQIGGAKLALLTFILGMPGLVLAQESGKQRPNILFICTDDQAPWAQGASGNKQAIIARCQVIEFKFPLFSRQNFDLHAIKTVYTPNKVLFMSRN